VLTIRPSTPAQSSAFDALGHVFAVDSEDRSLADLVERSFSLLSADQEPSSWYSVRKDGPTLRVTWQGEPVATGVDRMVAYSSLLAHVNRRAVAAADDDLLLRAGCVMRDSDVVLVSGARGSGKSTLVAALVARGFDYLADEVVAVDLSTALIRPFTRPLWLDDHAFDLLPEVVAIRTARSAGDASMHVVDLDRARVSARWSRVATTMIVFPECDGSGITALGAMPSGNAVVRLAEESFNLLNHGVAAFDTLERLTRSAPSFRLISDDPHAAADVIVETLSDAG
jgi:hypothetical protein